MTLSEKGNKMVEELWKELSFIDSVESIALGGSRAGSDYDEK